MYLEAGRKDVTPEPPTVGQVENGRLAVGPMYEDVVRTVDVPPMLPPHIPKRQLMDEAAEQTAAISRIADTLARMAEWRIAQDRSRSFMGDLQYAVQCDISTWIKAALIINCVTTLMMAAFLWVR